MLANIIGSHFINRATIECRKYVSEMWVEYIYKQNMNRQEEDNESQTR